MSKLLERIVERAIERALVGGGDPSPEQEAGSMHGVWVGQYVICRSRNEGVNAGFVSAIDDTGVVLSECRRLWYHKPADSSQSWYEGVANLGVSADSKLSATVESKLIAEDYSLTVCTPTAERSIRDASVHQG